MTLEEKLDLINQYKIQIRDTLKNKGIEILDTTPLENYAGLMEPLGYGGNAAIVAEEGLNACQDLFRNATKIASSVFSYKTWTSAYFPKVSTIGRSAFYGCTNLSSIYFPACVSVGAHTFYNCHSIASLELPLCKSIGSYAFWDCNQISSISLPICESIANHAFCFCSLFSVLDLPMCKYVGNSAFYDCSSLHTVNLPECSRIESYAFNSCYTITSLNLPKCEYIGASAFCSGAISLASLELPKCTHIGDNAFKYCGSLSYLKMGADSVAVLTNSNAFYHCEFWWSSGATGNIYVPMSLLASYMSATNWVYFSSRIIGY